MLPVSLPCWWQGEGTDVADGLEPVCVGTGIYYQSHFRWFRWFASGDVALLLVLLVLREIS